MNDEAESRQTPGESDELVPHEGHEPMEAGFHFDPEEPPPGDVEEPFDLPSDDAYRELVRSEPRRFAAMVVIVGVTFLAAGHLLRQPAFMTANDISRWCTVWSLLERGTYAIDDCPWQLETQDKIKWPSPKQLYAAQQKARAQGATELPEAHFYSSKPALISTVIAGILYPARRLTGVPLDRVVYQEREERWAQKPDPTHPGKYIAVLEHPTERVKWPIYPIYFDPVLILFNVIPYAVFLTFFVRALDRYARNDFSWYFGLIAAAFGTYLLPYTQTLNNHTLGAYAAFFTAYHFLRIWDERLASPWRFAATGFFAGLTAAFELPALTLPALLILMLLTRYPLRCILFFIPAMVLPMAAFMGAQYAEFHDLFLPYESFGTEAYKYEGSLWNSPLELDYFNEHPEPYWVYLVHMTVGHHGILSLTPIFFFSVWGMARLLGGRRLLTLCIILTGVTIIGLGIYYLRDPDAWEAGGPMFKYAWLLLSIPILFAILVLLSAIPWLRGVDRPMEALAWMTFVITIVVVAFYASTEKARNYGGSAQGLRWVMWLIPLWLLLLPKGIEDAQARLRLRRLAMLALAISMLSVGYAMRNPWSHPWILDAMEHLGVYPLKR